MILPYQYKRRTDNCQFHTIKISIQLYIIKKAFKKLTLKLRTTDLQSLLITVLTRSSVAFSTVQVQVFILSVKFRIKLKIFHLAFREMHKDESL